MSKELYKELNELNSCVSYEKTSMVLTSLIMCGKITSESKVIDVINLVEEYKRGGQLHYLEDILTVNMEDDNGN